MNKVQKAIQDINEILGVKGTETVATMETKENEVMNTGNAGAGAELVPDNVLLSEIVSLIPKYSSLLSVLPGFHGTNMPKLATVSVLGEAGFFEGAGEWKDNGNGIYDGVVGNAKNPTGEIEIAQRKMVLRIPVSEDLLTYSSVKNLEQWLKETIARSAARTQDSMIVNADIDGDINAGVTGIASATHHTKLGHVGLRSIGLADATMKYDMGAMDAQDFLALLSILGDNASNPGDIIWLMSRTGYNKTMGIPEFLDSSKSGKVSTFHTGAVDGILGSDVFLHRDIWKADATGIVSATTANNTKGTFIPLHKSAVQYGYGKELQIRAVEVPAKGIMLIGWYDFGFSIVNKLAGNTDPTFAIGYNATI